MQPWTEEETEAVRKGVLEGLFHEEIGVSIGRTKRQVCGKVKDLKMKGLLPHTQQYLTPGSYRISIKKKNSPKIIENIISDEDYPDFFNLDFSIPTILTSRLNQCKYPTPIEQAPSAVMKVCGKPVHVKGTPWRREINESCQWCLEHIAIVYSPPHG